MKASLAGMLCYITISLMPSLERNNEPNASYNTKETNLVDSDMKFYKWSYVECLSSSIVDIKLLFLNQGQLDLHIIDGL